MNRNTYEVPQNQLYGKHEFKDRIDNEVCCSNRSYGSSTKQYNGIECNFIGYLFNSAELANLIRRKDLQHDHTLLICHLYRIFGVQSFSKLRGYFCFSIHDKFEKTTLLVRDKVGTYKIFYFSDSDAFIYSSNIRLILGNLGSNSKLISSKNINLYLTFQYFPTTYTPFEHIHQVEAGKYISINGDGITSHRYWDIRDFKSEISDLELLNNLQDHYQEILSAFSGSMSVGAFCSGGVDSTVNQLMLKSLQKTFIALTVSFAEEEFDELIYAEAVAQHLNIEHIVENVCEENVYSIKEAVACMSLPIADQAVLPTYALVENNHHDIDLIFSGEGGDELWGPPRRWEDNNSLLEDYTDNENSLAADYIKLIECCNATFREAILLEDISREEIESAPRKIVTSIFKECTQKDTFFLLKYLQLKTWLPCNVISKDFDICSHFGVLPLFPLCSPGLQQNMFSMYSNSHFSRCVSKSFLRSLYQHTFPELVVNKAKHKFLVPIRNWRSQKFLSLIRNTLLGSYSFVKSYFDSNFMEKCINDYKLGLPDVERPLWSILILELWLKDVLGIDTPK
jgi:asparagine synthase (glutamine-hydrolysing)